MSKPGTKPSRLRPELLIRAYAAGIFPMADSHDSEEIYWVDPKVRGILPLDTFHISRRLRKKIRSEFFEIRSDTAFEAVISACAESGKGRQETWINAKIIDAYCSLHQMGFAHSIECWRDGQLAGGLYGVSLGGVFCGESMFARLPDASKVALVHLVARLLAGGYKLLDTQFVTDHLKQFGAVGIPADAYQERLKEALQTPAIFYSELTPAEEEAGLEALFAQSRTQTS